MSAIKHHHHHHHDIHQLCVATMSYNIIVVLLEVVLQIALAGHDAEDAVHFELGVQLFHIVWVLLLWVVQYAWMHRIEQKAQRNSLSETQKQKKFIWASLFMLGIHMILLHVLPRIIGIEMMHEHEHVEIQEMIILLLIIAFVSFLFFKREAWLQKVWMKNKRVVSLRKKIPKAV